MSLGRILAEDRRRAILEALDGQAGYAVNESVLKSALEMLGHRVARTQVRADLAWLEEHGLIRVEKLPTEAGELWLGHLLEDGQDVARGRAHPGVARRMPR